MKKLYEENDIKNIASAIREKSSSTSTYKPGEMAEAIQNIPSGGGEDINNYYAGSKVGSYTNISGLQLHLKKVPKLNNYEDIFWNNGGFNFCFYNCLNLTDISALKYWNVANIKSFTSMFNGCALLEDISALSNWNTPNLESIYQSFYGCEKISDFSPLTNWDTQKINTLYSTFYKCYMLIDLSPFSNWNTSNVTSLDGTFNAIGKNNTSTYINFNAIQNWDTSNVTTMRGTFQSIRGTTANTRTGNVKLNWNVNKVTSFQNMFIGNSTSYCLKGEFSGFYTDENVLSTSCTCYAMFQYQKELTKIDLKNVNKNISSVSYIFNSCTKLEIVDIRGFVCNQITTTSGYANALTSVPKSVKIIVKDETEKNWWQGKFSTYSNCFYTLEEAIAARIINE